jgi:hypothetical protein
MLRAKFLRVNLKKMGRDNKAFVAKMSLEVDKMSIN